MYTKHFQYNIWNLFYNIKIITRTQHSHTTLLLHRTCTHTHTPGNHPVYYTDEHMINNDLMEGHLNVNTETQSLYAIAILINCHVKWINRWTFNRLEADDNIKESLTDQYLVLQVNFGSIYFWLTCWSLNRQNLVQKYHQTFTKTTIFFMV